MLHVKSEKINYLMAALAVILAFIAILAAASPASAQGDAAECIAPDVTFVGEGAGEYTPADGQNLIVKRFSPFRFDIVGEAVAVADRGNRPPSRVWSVSAEEDGLIAVYDGVIEFGTLEAGTFVCVVVIDDDPDGRLTAVENETETVLTEYNPSMVQAITFVAPHTGQYRLVTTDSIGAFPWIAIPPTAIGGGEPSRVFLPIAAR